jgi:hypothetical protein
MQHFECCCGVSVDASTYSETACHQCVKAFTDTLLQHANQSTVVTLDDSTGQKVFFYLTAVLDRILAFDKAEKLPVIGKLTLVKTLFGQIQHNYPRIKFV